jgi:hypothetical protein
MRRQGDNEQSRERSEETTMSITTKLTTGLLSVLATGTFVSLGTVASHADVRCQMTNIGRPLCLNVPHDYYHHARCYYLPTVSNGRVIGLHSVCT